jgi:hypothetical protein
MRPLENVLQLLLQRSSWFDKSPAQVEYRTVIASSIDFLSRLSRFPVFVN